MEIYDVEISKTAQKQLKRLPAYIILKLQAWIEAVQNEGIAKVRKVPGFHDEPLKGKRVGQRSIRLSKAYRAIYAISTINELCLAEIIEVNKHEY